MSSWGHMAIMGSHGHHGVTWPSWGHIAIMHPTDKQQCGQAGDLVVIAQLMELGLRVPSWVMFAYLGEDASLTRTLTLTLFSYLGEGARSPRGHHPIG